MTRFLTWLRRWLGRPTSALNKEDRTKCPPGFHLVQAADDPTVYRAAYDCGSIIHDSIVKEDTTRRGAIRRAWL